MTPATNPAAASGHDDDERWERIDRALTWVPLPHYDDVAKLARNAVVEIVEERNRYREALAAARLAIADDDLNDALTLIEAGLRDA